METLHIIFVIEMNLEKHIGELLYDHNCVIVPDLGGFVANYTPAKIHPTQHTFSPPSKSIVFNINLKKNDGLLANQIATFEKKSYDDALKYIDFFVKEVNVQLKSGAKVTIDDVGTLYLDVERNIQFEPAPTNFLLDAFGLSSFHSPAIKVQTIKKRIGKELNDRDAIPLEKKKRSAKRLVAIAVIVPVLAAFIWIPFKTDLLKNINYSTINPFAKTEIVLPELKINAEVPVHKDTIALKPLQIDSIVQPVAATLVEKVVPDTTAVEVNHINLEDNFHLVAGCFQIEENALKFVQSLQAQSLNATIIGKNNKGLYVVSCGDFANRKDALTELNILRKVQPNAWLYRN